MLDALTAADLFLALLMLIGAALYSSVGHGGASAYIALMGSLQESDLSVR